MQVEDYKLIVNNLTAKLQPTNPTSQIPNFHTNVVIPTGICQPRKAMSCCFKFSRNKVYFER